MKKLYLIITLAALLLGSTAKATTEETYPLNFDRDSLTLTCSDRYLRGVSMRDADGMLSSFTISTDTPRKVYQLMTDKMLFVTKGQTTKVVVNYQSGPMHGYLYIDYNNDGQFFVEIGDDHKPTSNSELVCYSSLNGYNSEGKAASNAFAITFPAFIVPDTIPVGMYRARIKMDLNNSDPGGRASGLYSDSLIQDNGGAIVDFLLNISGGNCALKLETEHGYIYGASNAALPESVKPGSTTLSFVASAVKPGYELESFIVQHGYNFDGDSLILGNRQWAIDTVSVPEGSSKYKYTMPNKADGDIKVTARFKNVSSNYSMIWNDEFNAANGTPANSDKWVRCPRQTSTWNRLLSDTSAVCFQSDGNLVLRAIPNQDTSTDKAAMLTGGVQSRGKFDFLHGRFECRAKVNPHTGNFPAVWMMPTDGSDGWPACGEIDVMEQINTESRVYHTVHTHWTYTLGHRNDASPKSSFNETVDMTKYHIYALEWNTDSLIWFVDGIQRGFYVREPAHAAQKQWPYDKAFYIILNQSVGDGSWASSPDLSYTYEMDVDWVRVYQESLENSIEEQCFTPIANELQISVSKGMLSFSASQPKTISVHDLFGRCIFKGEVNEYLSTPLHAGIYLVDNKKVVVP